MVKKIVDEAGSHQKENMKVGRYKGPNGQERLGVVEGEEDSLKVLDLGVALKARRGQAPFANTMDGLIESGERGLDMAYEVQQWARREGEGSWLSDETEVPWLVPVKVRNCIAGGSNFRSHRDEAEQVWKKRGATPPPLEIPIGFLKVSSCMVPTRAQVQRPAETSMLDYEVECVAVVGWPTLRVSEREALKSVFGYTIMNDLSAREIQMKEMENHTILMGKNFPGFGPLGPWILTADELPDPAALELELRVNGDLRQRSDCRDLAFPVAATVAYWSRLGLDRGDLLTTGSPAGVALARPEPDSFYLKAGDVVHASSRQIGTLETRIV